MNRYGAQAMRHWQQFDPQRYAMIPNPEEFFTALGDEVMREIDLRARALEGSDNDHPGESYLEKVGRLNMAHFTAEGEVLRELVLIAAPKEEEAETPVQGTMGEHHAMVKQLRQEDQDQEERQTTQQYVDELNRRERLGLPLPDDHI